MCPKEISVATILPVRHQADLPQDRLIITDQPGEDAMDVDVLIVGGGPAGLSTAIELARLVAQDEGLGEVSIGVLEKAGSLGEHNLSGSVVNPRAFRELFPDMKDGDFPFRQEVTNETVYYLTEDRALRIPTPPTMHNKGLYSASICEIVRWLGEQAEGLGVDLGGRRIIKKLFVEGDRVTGVRTVPTGLDRDGNPGPSFEDPAELRAKVVVLAEGSRGPLGQAYRSWQGIGSANPQLFALGVKEVWQVKTPLTEVIHTMGWPLPRDAFGGSWMYPYGPDQISLGLVVGLDYRQGNVDVHELLQRMKSHPLFKKHFEGGELLEWGAKTIPEGGYYALPERRSGNGIVMVGDTAGFVDVPSLKGIHYAVQSGIYAARAIYRALKADDLSAEQLAAYDRMVDQSYIVEDLRRTRNMRLAFKDGFLVGAAKAGLMTLTGGRVPGKRIAMEADAEAPRTAEAALPFKADNALSFSKVDAVFKSGNATRDDIPSHLIVGPDVSGEVADFYAALCPAGVYERSGDELRVSPPNCVDCKATDVLGPRWTPREGGSGPTYRLM
jgi:electron-transferring-flavoprotein dehydrogenase